MADEELPKLYTVSEAAAALRISSRTLRRYMDESLIEFSSINAHAMRRYARFSQQQLQSFLDRNKQGMTTPERPKRTYNKRVKKNQRKKGKAA